MRFATLVRDRLIDRVGSAKTIDMWGLQPLNKINLKTKNRGAWGDGGRGEAGLKPKDKENQEDNCKQQTHIIVSLLIFLGFIYIHMYIYAHIHMHIHIILCLYMFCLFCLLL